MKKILTSIALASALASSASAGVFDELGVFGGLSYENYSYSGYGNDGMMVLSIGVDTKIPVKMLYVTPFVRFDKSITDYENGYSWLDAEVDFMRIAVGAKVGMEVMKSLQVYAPLDLYMTFAEARHTGSYLGYDTNWSSDFNTFGFGLGAGVEYSFTKNLSISGEVKYNRVAAYFSGFSLGANVHYRF